MENKILIGVPTADSARQAQWYDYFNMLEKPLGTIITFSHGQSPARNRNMIIEQAVEIGATHILFLDDDVAMPQDTLTRLLAHDKDIVTGVYLMRNHPHQPIIFDKVTDEGRCTHHKLTQTKGLIPIVNCGLGLVLIKTKVFNTMEKPWIRLGELEKDHWCDDIGFFNRVREQGYQLYCDPEVRAGHMAMVTIWPTITDDKWHVTYDTRAKRTVSIPLEY